ncbi:MAG: SDR family oxidoreductase [Polyangiaceae bacterium]
MNNKTVLITGSSTGIGREAALALLQRGHEVIVTGRKRTDLEAVRAEAFARGYAGVCHPVVLDVDSAESARAAHAEVLRLTGGRGIDALVNNAGYATAGPLIELSDEAMHAQFETNVFGLLRVTKLFAREMIERRQGRVLMIGSVSGRIPAPMLGAYHATKYALEALNDALRMELKGLGIDVVMIEPGTIRTEFAGRAIGEAKSQRSEGSLYDAVYARQAQITERFDRLAAPPKVVSDAIVKQIETSRPASRVVAPGRFLLLIAAIKVLPTCWVDALMRRVAGLSTMVLGGQRVA